GQALLAAWRRGAKFDGWSEYFKFDVWLEAFRETGIDPHFYSGRERTAGEVLPWDHLSAGVDKSFLRREYDRALAASPTPDCRRGECSACGVCQGLGVDIIDWGTP
ncbi:MAG TPA: B12-binding domain-containing radical SAM protein, partial [Negativicutes bacterium]|nr:B12-binding domain-containing radical SAM protein [Negativicutes bacterium]